MPRRAVIITLIVLSAIPLATASLAQTGVLHRHPEELGRLAIPVEEPDGHSLIVTMDPSGGNRRVLDPLPHLTFVQQAAYSRDGRWIAFDGFPVVKNREGREHLGHARRRQRPA